MTDPEIIHIILSQDDIQLGKAINFLYKKYNGYKNSFRFKFNLSAHEVNEAQDEAILNLIKQIRSGKFKNESSIGTFYYRIFNNKCIDIARKEKHHLKIELPTDLPLNIADSITSKIENEELTNQLQQFIRQLKGKNCKFLLIDYYYYNYSMEGICEKYGYKNPNAANTKKNECMNELKKMVSKKMF